MVFGKGITKYSSKYTGKQTESKQPVLVKPTHCKYRTLNTLSQPDL